MNEPSNAPPRASAPRHSATWTPAALALALALGAGLPAQNVAVAEHFTTVSARTGSYLDTRAPYDTVETLTEAETGGNPRKRTSVLEHHWDFGYVNAGPSATLYVRAARTDSGEGDDFEYFWSVDQGQTWASTGHTTNSTTLPLQPVEVGLPKEATGKTLWIRVVDTDRRQGNRSLDTLTVDFLAISVSLPVKPAAPASVYATGKSASTVLVGWSDVATEDGYRVLRFDGGKFVEIGRTDADETVFLDEGRLVSTSYDYRIVAFNVAGNSPESATARGTTRSATEIQVGFLAPNSIDAGHDVDAAGTLGIALTAWNSSGGYSVWVATRDASSGTWTKERVVAEGEARDFAFAPDGTPSVLYQYSGDRAVYFAERRAGAWTTRRIAGDLFTPDMQLDFDPTDPLGQDLAIAYVNKDKRIEVARRVGGSWTAAVVAELTYVSGLPCLAFESGGGLVVAYRSQSKAKTGTLEVVRNDGSGWTAAQIVDSGRDMRFMNVNLAVEPVTGRAVIAYAAMPSPNATGSGDLRLAAPAGNGWQIESVADIGRESAVTPRLAYDAAGTPHLAVTYGQLHPTRQGLYLMRRVAAQWHEEQLAPGADIPGSTWFNSLGISVDALGKVWCSYSGYLFDRAATGLDLYGVEVLRR